MFHQRNLLPALLLAAFLFCACRSGTLPIEQVTVGQDQDQVLAILGDPDETRIDVKQSEFIWGPEEEWWHDLEMGTRIAIWSYNLPDGRFQIYFLRGAKTVAYTAFIDNNIVYEAQ